MAYENILVERRGKTGLFTPLRAPDVPSAVRHGRPAGGHGDRPGKAPAGIPPTVNENCKLKGQRGSARGAAAASSPGRSRFGMRMRPVRIQSFRPPGASS